MVERCGEGWKELTTWLEDSPICWLGLGQWQDILSGCLVAATSSQVVKISLLGSVKFLKEGIICSEIFIWEVVFSIYYRMGFLFLPSLALRIISFMTQGGRTCVSDSFLSCTIYFYDQSCLLDSVYRSQLICLVMLYAFLSSISKLVLFCLSYTLSLGYSFLYLYLVPQMLVSSCMYELLGVLSSSIILGFDPFSLLYAVCLICVDEGLVSFSTGLSSFYFRSIFRLEVDCACLGMDCLMALISFIISLILDSYSLFRLQYSSMLVFEGECLQGEWTQFYFLGRLAFGVSQWILSLGAVLMKLPFLAETLSQASLKVRSSLLLVVTFYRCRLFLWCELMVVQNSVLDDLLPSSALLLVLQSLFSKVVRI